jgi:hypothetical protein
LGFLAFFHKPVQMIIKGFSVVQPRKRIQLQLFLHVLLFVIEEHHGCKIIVSI